MTESTSPQPETAESTDTKEALIRTLVDLGPLFVFFGLYFLIGEERANAVVGAGDVSELIIATVAYMIATAAALTFAYTQQGRIAPMPLITGVVVLVFGGLTVVLQNDTFIKMKPTIVNMLFASILIAGLMSGRTFMKYLFGEIFALNDQGWRVLTIRWSCFFIFLAVLNEVIWRNFSEEFWVSFKVWGVLPLTMIFGMFQMPLLTKYAPSVSKSD